MASRCRAFACPGRTAGSNHAGLHATLSRPDVDVLDGLTTAIIVDQEQMGTNARSTAGTATTARGGWTSQPADTWVSRDVASTHHAASGCGITGRFGESG